MTNAAVVGLGTMGGAIARHLVEAGWAVTGFDPSEEACEAARGAGIGAATDLSGIAAASGPIILSLPAMAAAQAVVDVLVTLNAPRLVIETSTLAPEEKHVLHERLHRRGHRLLDCPISGTGAQMAKKDVVVYASGDSSALAEAEPLLCQFSREVLNLGDFGNGTRMKLIANHLVAVHNVAAAEAVLLGQKSGFSMDMLLRAIGTGAGNSRMFELRGPTIAAQCYEPAAMKLSLWAKDMALVGAYARELGAATPLLDAVAPLYAQAVADGRGQQDTAAVAEVLRAAASGVGKVNENEHEKEE